VEPSEQKEIITLQKLINLLKKLTSGKTLNTYKTKQRKKHSVTHCPKTSCVGVIFFGRHARSAEPLKGYSKQNPAFLHNFCFLQEWCLKVI